MKGNPIQLHQVLLNLIVNGCDAMPATPPEERKVEIATARKDACIVQVSVTDSAPGIAPGMVARIFEAFFSTKETGLGMGLAICRAIIKAHGGELRAENNPAGGATFHFTLRPFEPSPAKRSAPSPAAGVLALETTCDTPKVLLGSEGELRSIVRMVGRATTSIRNAQSIARLSRTFSRSLSAADIAEPLVSLDDNQPAEMAAELMRSRAVSVLGVRLRGVVARWVGVDDLTGGTLADCVREFSPETVLDDTASLDVVLCRFKAAAQLFIAWHGEVTAMITRTELQKPPVRMWLFGAITILEANLAWAIEELYPDDTWQHLISDGRREKAQALLAERHRRGSECRLLDCLQLKDKADILISKGSHLRDLGLNSRREADRMMRGLEELRNQLAHSQELAPEHLATASHLGASIQTILGAELAQQIVKLHRELPEAAPSA